MANLFGIFTAIVLALAGFVAYQNKAAYEREIEETHRQKGLLAASQKRLKTAQDLYADTHKKRLGVDAEVVALTDKEFKQKKANADLTSANATKTAEIAEKKEKLDIIREKTAKIGNINELAAKMRATKLELEETTQLITGGNTKFDSLTTQHAQADAQATATKIRFEHYANSQSLGSLDTRIRSIYPTWGFVTLAAGNSAGVVNNSTLAVVRDGTIIAKLLVTSVESNSASSSIIPDSMPQDTTLMVGDRVIPVERADKPAKN